MRGEAARFPGRLTATRSHLGHEDVEVAVDVGGVGDVGAVGRPARLRVVASARRDLARGASLNRHDPDPPLVRERDGLAVGRPRRVGGRSGHRRREVALHVHAARAACAREVGVAAREGVGVVVLLLGRGDAGGQCRQQRDRRHDEPEDSGPHGRRLLEPRGAAMGRVPIMVTVTDLDTRARPRRHLNVCVII